MSTGSTNLLVNLPLNHRQSREATPTSSRPTSSHAYVGPMHAAGAHSGNLQLPTPPVPADETLQKAILEYVNKLSDDDKAAFQSAPNIMERLQEMEVNGKSLLPSSLTTRVEKVLQCIRSFMASLGVFIQHHPEISSLVVGGVNCILTVGASNAHLLTIHVNISLNSLSWGILSSLSVSLE